MLTRAQWIEKLKVRQVPENAIEFLINYGWINYAIYLHPDPNHFLWFLNHLTDEDTDPQCALKFIDVVSRVASIGPNKENVLRDKVFLSQFIQAFLQETNTDRWLNDVSEFVQSLNLKEEKVLQVIFSNFTYAVNLYFSFIKEEMGGNAFEDIYIPLLLAKASTLHLHNLGYLFHLGIIDLNDAAVCNNVVVPLKAAKQESDLEFVNHLELLAHSDLLSKKDLQQPQGIVAKILNKKIRWEEIRDYFFEKATQILNDELPKPTDEERPIIKNILQVISETRTFEIEFLTINNARTLVLLHQNASLLKNLSTIYPSMINYLKIYRSLVMPLPNSSSFASAKAMVRLAQYRDLYTNIELFNTIVYGHLEPQSKVEAAKAICFLWDQPQHHKLCAQYAIQIAKARNPWASALALCDLKHSYFLTESADQLTKYLFSHREPREISDWLIHIDTLVLNNSIKTECCNALIDSENSAETYQAIMSFATLFDTCPDIKQLALVPKPDLKKIYDQVRMYNASKDRVHLVMLPEQPKAKNPTEENKQEIGDSLRTTENLSFETVTFFASSVASHEVKTFEQFTPNLLTL